MKKRFPRHVALRDDAKTQLIETLHRVLAAAVDLQFQVKQAHWDIKGPQFFARFQLLDKVIKRIDERAATLSGFAKRTVRLSPEDFEVSESDLGAPGRTHNKKLIGRFEVYRKLLSVGIEEAEGKSDAMTVDLYTEALRAAELDIWFLDSQHHV